MNETKLSVGLTLLLFCVITIQPKVVYAQKAHISEATKQIKTYPFGDPSPVPILTKKPEIYPYSRFDGYADKGRPKSWKVVTLQNKYIKLSVLPEVGGKIWGAIEKSTGNDFIYKNDVLKFRDVGLRGPWTSGGIEFNFGYFGHTPTTATPVNYVLKNNKDGSVSCIIGDLDLASRTQWRVEIRLPKDAAVFQTKAFWYNGTSLDQSYYAWSNAAIHAGDSLQYYFPGNHYLGHGGDTHPWPFRKGKNVSIYSNNNFGGSKSYHVLGAYTNYYGAYQHKKQFGFGHWARFDELPGQKIWIWGLSRAGEIWKDLLTDKSGQYSEVQAGRLFSQAMLTSGFSSPFNQYLFSPQAADRWKEYWFPVKDIGGIDDASRRATINVSQDSAGLRVGVNAIQEIHDTLIVSDKNTIIHKEAVNLQPMGVFKTTIDVPSGKKKYAITLGKDLHVLTKSQPGDIVNRPLNSTQKYDTTTAEGLYERGVEQYAFRHYGKALQLFLKSLNINDNNRHVLARVAEVYTRKAMYHPALKYARQALANDTYDPEGNFIYGVINRRLGNLIEAKEAFGWAARSMKYRSAGWEKMAELDIMQHRWDDAIYYAQKALDFNTLNVNAKKVLAIAYRKESKKQNASKIIANLLQKDPLSHFAYFEKYLQNKTKKNRKSFTSLIRNELSYETYLELALTYYNMGLNKEANEVLLMSPSNPIVNYWLAYLNRNNKQDSKKYLHKALTASPKLVFPFRHETISTFKWALKQNDDWKTKYYLGLIMWDKGQDEEALRLMNNCKNKPDFAPFYLSRSYLQENVSPDAAKKDIKQALKLAPNEWRAYRRMGDWFVIHQNNDDASDILRKAAKKFPQNYYTGSKYARVLYKQKRYEKSLDILNSLNVLPSEGAKFSHHIFEQDHLMLALENILSHHYKEAMHHLKKSHDWPEHLGTGKPFDPDERAQAFLKAYIFDTMGKSQLRDSLYKDITNYTTDKLNHDHTSQLQFNFNNIAALLTYIRQGKRQKAKVIFNNLAEDISGQDLIKGWLSSEISNKKMVQTNINRILTNKSSSIPSWLTILVQLNY